MHLVYDRDSDTLQTRTRRYQRDRGLLIVNVPPWDEHIEDVLEEECIFCTEPVAFCEHWNA